MVKTRKAAGFARPVGDQLHAAMPAGIEVTLHSPRTRPHQQDRNPGHGHGPIRSRLSQLASKRKHDRTAAEDLIDLRTPPVAVQVAADRDLVDASGEGGKPFLNVSTHAREHRRKLRVFEIQHPSILANGVSLK